MTLDIFTQVQFVKGVGPKLALVLNKLNIHTVKDLLFYFPTKYLDRSRLFKISELKVGDNVSILAKVVKHFELRFKNGRKVFEVVFSDGTHQLSAKWFYYYKKSFEARYAVGKSFLLSGSISDYRGRVQMMHPDCQTIDELDDEALDIQSLAPGIIPVYPAGQGISSKLLRKIINHALSNYALDESLPATINSYQISLAQALTKMHQPEFDDYDDTFISGQSVYHQRAIFEEFFYLQLGLLLKKQNEQLVAGVKFNDDFTLVEQLKSKLPFTLTDSQNAALKDIYQDMLAIKPMNRLLQGDVGSGKTIVALMAALLAYQNGYQVAVMVPTEILAEQHYKNWVRQLYALSITPYLLTSSTTNSDREKILSRLKSNQPQIVVGTHALIEDEVYFSKLGLVIIDEQHRFGVKQRMKLMQKSLTGPLKAMPDVLVMTATPIPRSLAMTVYGDLDLSLMRGYPRGRGTITTKIVSEKNRDKMYLWLGEQIAKGRQVFIVYPLVEESEKLSHLKDAESAHKKLSAIFAQHKVGLIHGRLDQTEKDQMMLKFARNELQILVATTVIEVGIDVPNATVMVIEHAERFGLSQLHQLRGRVGRGEHSSYCFLLPDYRKSAEANDRLKIMVETNDGFRISEEDLRIRGPGDFLGTRQSGLPDFMLANLLRDVEILEQARASAIKLLSEDPLLAAPEHQLLKNKLYQEWGSKLKLAQVG